MRLRAVARATASRLLLVNEALGTAAVLTLVSVPWALGGLQPGRADLTWAILLAFATGFLSVCVTVLAAFDLARDEAAAPAGGEEQDAPPPEAHPPRRPAPPAAAPDGGERRTKAPLLARARAGPTGGSALRSPPQPPLPPRV